MLLTIAIPTYKRHKYVVDNVRHLLPQVLSHAESVRMLVTDNHSEDGTYEELLEIEKEHPEVFKVYEQKKNIGWMNNFFFGIEHSDSEFVYLLGDDDIVSPNFLDIVLPLIISGGDKLGLLHFNYVMTNDDLQNGSLLYKDFDNNEMVVTYTNAEEFVKKFNRGPSFISSVIFRKRCMLEGKKKNLQSDTFAYSWFLCLYTGIAEYEVIFYKMPLCLQRVGGFYPAYCTNYVIGMFNAFKHLDIYMPGVLSYWKNLFAKEHDNIAMCINQIIDYRDIYIPLYSMFEEALPEGDLRRLLHVALKRNKWLARKEFRLYWMQRKLNKKFGKIAKAFNFAL